MGDKYTWTCEHCGSEFETEDETTRHEKTCRNSTIKIRGKVKPVIDVWEGFKLGIGFGIGMSISSVIIFTILLLLFGGTIGTLLSQIL